MLKMLSKKYLLAACIIIFSALLLGGCGVSPHAAPDVNYNLESSDKDIMAETGKFRLVESDGTVFVSESMPERIIVLSVATAKLMDRLGIEMVGITRTMQPLPGKLAELPTVGFPMEPDLEAITALNPDLVIVSSNFKPNLGEKMAQHKLPVFFLDNQSYAGTINSVEMLGRAFGKEEEASQLLKEMKAKEKAALSLAEGKPSPRVLILFGAGGSFLMARETSYAGSMVKMLGGENITEGIRLAEGASAYLPISMEQVAEFNPEIILRISHGTPEETQKLFEEEFLKNPLWQTFSAWQNNRVYDLPSALFFSNPGPEVVEALMFLAEIMYKQDESNA